MTIPWWSGALVLAAWSLGIVAAVLLQPPPVAMLAATLLVALAVSLLHRPLAVATLAAGGALCLGLLRGGLAVPPSLAPALAGQMVTIVGQVDDDPVQPRRGNRLVVRVPSMHTRVLATVYGTQAVHYGDLVLLTGRLEPAPRFEAFDYAAYLADHGISGVLQSAHLVRVVPHPGDPIHAAIFTIRHGLVAGIDRGLPEPQAALLLGVVFGYRQALPRALEQQMIASGLIHIVVISGLKVSLLARLVHQGLGRFLPRAAPFVALFAMLVYALLAGASAAALRAAAMGALVVLAGTLKRDSHVYTSLALTAALMLGLKPALAHDVSFQLSFAGTLGIASLTDPIAARLPWIPSVLRDPFAATVAAEAATWPLMLANFHQVSFIAPVANALVLPLLPVIMVVGGGGAIIGSIVGLAGWPPLQIAGAIASWFRVVIESTASLPLANLTAPYFPGRWLAAAALLNAGALTALKLRTFFWQKRVWAVLGGGALIVSALLLVRPDGRVHVYALDVGTGSAVLIRTANGEQVLFDGGPDADKFAQAIGRALPPTARTLKLWVITGGRPIQIGAGSAVLSRFRVERIVVTDPDPWTPTLRSLVQQAQAAGIRVETSRSGIAVDGVVFRVDSDARTWLIRAGRGSIAIVPPETGWQSLPPGIDGAIFTCGGPPAWEGSRGISVIQVATNRRDGLPARALLQALREAQIYRTDRLGSVELVSDWVTYWVTYRSTD